MFKSFKSISKIKIFKKKTKRIYVRVSLDWCRLRNTSEIDSIAQIIDFFFPNLSNSN